MKSWSRPRRRLSGDAFAWLYRQLSKLMQINSGPSARDLLVRVVGRLRRGGS